MQYYKIPTPLHKAVEFGNFEAAHQLLTKGWGVNSREPYRGNTPLHIAAKTRNSKIVGLLVNDHHAKVNLRNKEGVTALKYALDNRDVNSARLIVLKAGGEMDAFRGARGLTALHLAAAENDEGLIFTLLANPNVEVDVRDALSFTPLHLAAIRNVGHSHFASIEALLNRKADPNAVNQYEKTPFDYLVKNRHTAGVVKLFHDYGVKVLDGASQVQEKVKCFLPEVLNLHSENQEKYESIFETLKHIKDSVKMLKEQGEKLEIEVNVMREEVEEFDKKIKSLTRYFNNETRITHSLLFVLIIYFFFYH